MRAIAVLNQKGGVGKTATTIDLGHALANEVGQRIRRHFPVRLPTTLVSEASALAESAGAGRTIFQYGGEGKSAGAFMELADGLLHNRVVAHEQEANSNFA